MKEAALVTPAQMDTMEDPSVPSFIPGQLYFIIILSNGDTFMFRGGALLEAITKLHGGRT